MYLQEQLDMQQVQQLELDSLFGIENIIGSANEDTVTLRDTDCKHGLWQVLEVIL